MAGIFLFDEIGAWFRRRGLQKRLELAKSWPIASGEVLSWSIVDADKDAVSSGTPHQIEAKYYFTLKWRLLRRPRSQRADDSLRGREDAAGNAENPDSLRAE